MNACTSTDYIITSVYDSWTSSAFRGSTCMRMYECVLAVLG